MTPVSRDQNLQRRSAASSKIPTSFKSWFKSLIWVNETMRVARLTGLGLSLPEFGVVVVRANILCTGRLQHAFSSDCLTLPCLLASDLENFCRKNVFGTRICPPPVHSAPTLFAVLRPGVRRDKTWRVRVHTKTINKTSTPPISNDLATPQQVATFPRTRISLRTGREAKALARAGPWLAVLWTLSTPKRASARRPQVALPPRTLARIHPRNPHNPFPISRRPQQCRSACHPEPFISRRAAWKCIVEPHFVEGNTGSGDSRFLPVCERGVDIARFGDRCDQPHLFGWRLPYLVCHLVSVHYPSDVKTR